MDILSSLDELQAEGKNRIENKNAVIGILIFLSRAETRGSALRFLRTVQRDFFIPQFQGRFNIRKRPVVLVDHPLDSRIPFKPQHVSIYLTFTHFWIKSIYFLYREFGPQTLPEIKKFILDLDELYKESAQVYRRVQSTTNRPHHLGGFYFKVIHLFDPHLHCIPSLHVGVVGLTYLSISRLIDRFAGNPEDYRAEKEHLWKQAVLITESILFIKQHSVNCVAAGLYTLSSHRYGYAKEDAHRVIDALFTGEGNTLEDSAELREYIRNLYDHFLGKERELRDWESRNEESSGKTIAVPAPKREARSSAPKRETQVPAPKRETQVPAPKREARVLIDFLLSYQQYLETWEKNGTLPLE